MGEPWALADLDEDAREIARQWAVATDWHWVDAVAWVAAQDPEIMAVLAGYRDYRKRLHPSFDVGEGANRDVLKTILDPKLLELSARKLRVWCAGGALTVTSISSGQRLSAADWKGGRVPMLDTMPNVLLPVVAVRQLCLIPLAAEQQPRSRKAPKNTDLDAWAFAQGNVSRCAIDRKYLSSNWAHDDPNVRPTITEARDALNRVHGKRERGRERKSNRK